MIRDLLAVLDPSQRPAARLTIGWMVLAAMLQGIAVSMLVPVLIALLHDDLSGSVRWLVLAAAVGAAALAAHYVQAMRTFELAITILTTLRGRLGRHVVRMPLGWFSDESAGRLSRIGSAGVMTVCQSLAHLLQPLVAGVATPVVICLFLLLHDWRLGLVALAGAPFLLLCFRWSARALGASDELTHETAVRCSSAVLEYARCQSVLRAAGRTRDGVYPPLEHAIEQQRRAGRRKLWMTVPGMLLTGTVLQAVYSVVILLGIWLVTSGRLDAAVLVAVLALLARFIGPLALVSELSGGMRMARNELRRVREVLDVSPLPEPARSAPIVAPGVVELDHVTFGYDGTTVLHDVSLRATPGTITAVVGPSGAGKSTITRLVARFWDVDSGVVRVGGVDVREQTTEALMAQVAVVFQDVYLFDDTLAANVRLGREDATDEEIVAAARLSGVDEIVQRLPAGWHTRVGEGGALLSGGERQRVSVARALLKRAPVVVLDEATASLDPANERLVRAAVVELARHSTVLVVAHTAAMIAVADEVTMLDGGRVVEQGRRVDLVHAGGPFAQMFHARERAAGWRIAAHHGS